MKKFFLLPLVVFLLGACTFTIGENDKAPAACCDRKRGDTLNIVLNPSSVQDAIARCNDMGGSYLRYGPYNVCMNVDY